MVPRDETAAADARPSLPVLQLTTEEDSEPQERDVLFTIDDTDYTVWTNPPAGIGITALDILADGRPYSEPRANRFVMAALLGEEGYRALVSYPQLTKQQYAQVSEACSRLAMGAMEGPKTR